LKYTPHTPEDKRLITERIGVRNIEELFSGIPKDIRVKGKLNLPGPASELEITAELEKLAASNSRPICFAGCGAYDHYLPAIVDTIVSRPEFYTAYTPYQAEVSQGTLQFMYEFQSLVCRLFDMEVANDSMYDCASALAETAHMARDITHRQKILVSAGINPNYLDVVKTYARGLNVPLGTIPLKNGTTDLAVLKQMLDDQVAAIMVQHPNFFGTIEPMNEISRLVHAKNGLLIVSVDPLSLGLLNPPGKYDADIAVGEGQSLGIPLSFGGPYLGLLTTRKRFIRKMPGRLVARTIDSNGKKGYVLALQTREQHIRRERATSNICTNQALCALAATVYLAYLGPRGIRATGEHCLAKSHYLARRISELPGFELKNEQPFFKEFAVRTPVSASSIINAGLKNNILAGVDLGRFSPEWKNQILVAVTEKRTRTEMDRYIDFLKSEFGGQ